MACNNYNLGVVILAAGKGTRMKSGLPKVLHEILGEPMIFYIVDAVRKAFNDECLIGVVVGYEGDLVESYLNDNFENVDVIWQHEQLGTGHALKCGIDFWGKFENIIVLPGDVPLITPSFLEKLYQFHISENADITLTSVEMDNPFGYGRIVKDVDGRLIKIVEEKDADDSIKEIKEVNAGVYCFKTKILPPLLEMLDCNNAQGEYYLTDVMEHASKMKKSIKVFKWKSEELFGVNDRFSLSYATRRIQERINSYWAKEGVSVESLENVFIGPKVVISPDVFISSFSYLLGETYVGGGSFVGPFSVIKDSSLEAGVVVEGFAVVENSLLKNNVKIGPFVYVRENTVLKESAYAGKFVEIKKSVIGKATKVPHLSYIGDATIGDETNIGAGTITCNYDGKKKNPTYIGSRCFIGSDTMLVAPVKLEDDVFTAAGSVITTDVPKGALAVARAKQRNIVGWVYRKRGKVNKEE